ncbi:hypothetical protein FNYG_07042 [Fusarium nygamai]|uniref:Uncharacterized protein n=1 Tax=Gibberella nygamai TaxID=42673 RepID=A0A2K0WBQ4_GIBNY|nr:hypothetical protein FNYG_07042 [Fusarium nygamai]
MPPLADPVAGAGSNTNNHSGRSRSRSRSPRGGRNRSQRRGDDDDSDDEDDERQTLSPPALSDSDALTETVVRHSSRVTVSRRADAHVDTHEFLTSREKYIIFMLLQPIRNTREPPYRITCGYRNSILKSSFDHWKTKLRAPANPILPGRLMEHTFIEGGTLKSDQPLPNSKRRAFKTVVEDYRTRGAAVRLGVYINPDMNSISFPWTDTEGNAVTTQVSHSRTAEPKPISAGKPSSNMTVCLTKMVKTSASAPQVLDLFQHVNGNKGFGAPGVDDPANEPAVAPITKYDNLAPDKYQKAPKFQSNVGQSVEFESTPITAKVAWTAGQNKLVVLPWKREFANLQRVTDAEPAVTQTEGHSLASNVDMAMAHHLDAFRARQFENSHPSCVFASLSEYARGIAQADKQTWSEAIAAWNE